MADRLIRAILAALALGPLAVQAQLADPTRPPAAAAPGMPDDAALGGRQLQSVLLSGGRKLAVIDGSVVPLGGSIGDARVVRITETEVVLKSGEETETLKLYPSVEKQAIRRGARNKAQPAKPGERGGAR
jgi:MSHA biogenesis protein MshK